MATDRPYPIVLHWLLLTAFKCMSVVCVCASVCVHLCVCVCVESMLYCIKCMSVFHECLRACYVYVSMCYSTWESVTVIISLCCCSHLVMSLSQLCAVSSPYVHLNVFWWCWVNGGGYLACGLNGMDECMYWIDTLWPCWVEIVWSKD